MSVHISETRVVEAFALKIVPIPARSSTTWKTANW